MPVRLIFGWATLGMSRFEGFLLRLCDSMAGVNSELVRDFVSNSLAFLLHVNEDEAAET